MVRIGISYPMSYLKFERVDDNYEARLLSQIYSLAPNASFSDETGWLIFYPNVGQELAKIIDFCYSEFGVGRVAISILPFQTPMSGFN